MLLLGKREGVNKEHLVKEGEGQEAQLGEILEGSEEAILEVVWDAGNLAYLGEILRCLRQLRPRVKKIQIDLAKVYCFHCEIIRSI